MRPGLGSIVVPRQRAARALAALAALLALGAAPVAAGETPVNGCILTDAVNWLHLGPAPRHVAQGLVMIEPLPLHWPHVRATVKKPCWYRSFPRP